MAETQVGLDLCALGNFDTTDGSWSFATQNLDAYPQGDYSFLIEGNAGTGGKKSDSTTVEIRFISPCMSADLELV